MRRSIVPVIRFRELRGALRDRRTLFMIAVLPVLLYPLAGFGLTRLSRGPGQVVVLGEENMPAPSLAAARAAAWFAAAPAGPGCPLDGPARAAAAFALAET